LVFLGAIFNLAVPLLPALSAREKSAIEVTKYFRNSKKIVSKIKFENKLIRH
jgi:hypothetical protein